MCGSPPTDPLTVRLLAEIEDLETIPGPRTVGPENYSRILDAFLKRGWAGFEEAFDLVVPKTRTDYTEVKRNLLREPVFSPKTQRNMLRLAKAFLSAKTPEAQQAAVQAELEKIEAERGCGAPAKSPSEDQSSQNAELPAGRTDRTPEPDGCHGRTRESHHRPSPTTRAGQKTVAGVPFSSIEKQMT